MQQLVAIGRAIDVNAQVLVLDEPTSSLDVREVAELMAVIRRVRDQGVAVLFVSHFLDQIYQISDRITVLRNGELVGEYLTRELPRLQLVSKMIGKDLAVLEALEEGTKREAVERIEGGAFLVGERAGPEGLHRAVRPRDPPRRDRRSGRAARLRPHRARPTAVRRRPQRQRDHPSPGTAIRLRSPRLALDHKIAFASENRKAEGLISDLSVRANIVLAMQADRGWVRQIPRRQQDEVADRYIKALDIRPANPETLVRNLSGGNQQKVLLARWLLTEPKLLILDEPTSGIDVGAKAQIQKLVADLAEKGMAVIFISAELEEVLRLSHRIGILRDRRKVAEIVNSRERQRSTTSWPSSPRKRSNRHEDHLSVSRPLSGRRSSWSRCCWRTSCGTAPSSTSPCGTAICTVRPVDILRRAAPIVLVALGMTLVIATRGIDLSVGAVAAISGSWASMYINSSADRARSAWC